MGKKTPDSVCLENYQKLCDLFHTVVPDSGRFDVVYGCGVDVGMSNFIVVRRTTYTYSSYAIGYDRAANEIVILPVDTDIQTYGEPIYLKKADIGGAKIGWLSKEITIKDKRLPKKYIQFSVQEQLNDDPDEVCICVKQNEQAKDFLKFFKEQYAN